MPDKLRFSFEGEVIPTAPIHLSFPDPRADKSEPPAMIFYGTRRYFVTGTTLRGGYRRYGAKNILSKQRAARLNTAFTSEQARVLLIGGVKGSGDSRHLTPKQLEYIRESNPQLDIFGMGDPLMLGGTLYMGFMISDEEVHTKVQFDRPISDPMITVPIIRRSLLTDTSITMSDISDPETMMEGAAANRRRSQIKSAITTWERLDRKTRKNPLTPRDLQMMQAAKETLNKETGQSFESAEAARLHLDSVIDQMRASGQKDVSEQNIQSVSVIPAGVRFSHKMELHNTTRAGVGLFMWAIHDKHVFNPIIGGLAARGCGGYCTHTYQVRRQEGYRWIDDCTLTIRPNTGIEFTNAESSVLKATYDEWADIDIRKFKFDYDFLMDTIKNGNGSDDDA